MRKFIDIGANLTDLMYSGVYNGSSKHVPDLGQVLKRSWDAGLEKIIITGGNLDESRKALKIAESDERLFTTVGVHPTRCSEFEADPQNYLAQMKHTMENGARKVVAIGECGLDYDRLQFCPKEVQKMYFEMQLNLTKSSNLPLFLHCRNAAQDLAEILGKYPNLRGVVHSFDGTLDEARRFIDMNFLIGLNGCSLKTKENLETVSALPSDKILIETDCPWCEIRPTHAGYSFISKENLITNSVKKEKWRTDCMVKSRNEPCNIRQVLDVIAVVKNENPDTLSKLIYENTLKLFFPDANNTSL
ncbi:deoxyribonuclease TATDN1 [Tribolium castaneum]|uniref:Deoxyribonuclease TATDN1 n=1 Tax=Tribolium castaneum TaxID=7070 RepID=D6WQZ9_TRICA|nr:PREDICTED: putative deoxyribonuclease TATDN1 [Tribolium castaneum]EFA06484.1 Putative deoxyribonuclease TATDN1-like Protein [Tribolium castaneum]|eukprot:XP_970061.1 PREDICTED: putative deoxyribonuclease TATDN1 [Tribolium castaneum]